MIEEKKLTHTEAMWKTHAPFDNPFQGPDKRVLFVCSAGILRSATAARLYAKRYNTRAAGSYGFALIPVTSDLLLWANEVVFVNEENYKMVAEKFDLDSFPGLQVKVLDIPDEHEHMAPELVAAFKEQYEDVE
jgi:predicted protein tyrosine phosphatase